MEKEMIVRAWKDPAYRASLTVEERAALPESPSGTPATELTELELGQASGGRMVISEPIVCETQPPICSGRPPDIP